VPELPSGTVSFLFTDLEGSTRLWEEHPGEMGGALARHDEILRVAIESHRGHVVKTTGDGAHAAFVTASDAIDAAVAAQLLLDAEPWRDTGQLRVRMGIHTGGGELRDGDYYSSAVNRAARLMSVAHGGQIVVSLATSELVRGTTVELMDLGMHRLRDLGEPEHVFQVMHPGLGREFPLLRSLDAFPTNLPLQLTTFVGRDDDVAEVLEAVHHSRVVTLIGVGGVGKTRLAVQAAAEALPRYRDGVWLCELGPLSDPAALPDVVAASLGVQQRPGQSMTESLVATLRSKELLVVLDNCEHLLDAAAQLVAALMAACPSMTVLATGREGLGVRGERMMMVRSLPLPGEGAATEEILAADAVQLFTERAEQAGGQFELDEETAATIAQLCRRLDGIPLAIELAAARTRMMSPHEIAARLDERFRLLTGGSRTAVERHRTLRQAVDWSYDLLDPRERAILDCLGVFAGGFTLGAAEAVASGGDVDPLYVLDGVTQLVDKSLVVAEREDHGTRYRLLETIRQYALERLEENGATDALRRRHAQWCAQLVADAAAGSHGPDEPEWVTRIDRELDNLRAAITWATGANDIELAMGILGEGPRLVINTSYGYTLSPWAAAALRIPGATDHRRHGAVLALRAADHRRHDRFVDAERDACDAIDVVLRPENSFSSLPWGVLLQVYAYLGRAEKFLARHEEFLSAVRLHGDDYDVAFSLALVAINLMALGRAEDGLDLAEEAMVIAERVGAPSVIAITANALSGAVAQQDPELAASLVDVFLANAISIGADLGVSQALGSLGRIGVNAEDPRWATRLRAVVDRTYDAGDTRLLLVQLDNYSQALLQISRFEPSALLYGTIGRHAQHLVNPISITRREAQRAGLTAALGEDRFLELVTDGAGLDVADAVTLARQELDRVIDEAANA